MSVHELLNALAPDGVPFKPIGEFAECSAGATPSSEVPEYWEDGTIPWMSSGEVNKGTVYDTEKKITQAAFDSCSTKMLPANVVVMALAGQGKTRGNVARTRIPLCTNQSLAAIIPDAAQVDSDFLYFFLTTQYSKLRDVSSGDGTRGGLNLQMIRSYLVPVPPLQVQREIVRILDQFTALEAALEAELEARSIQLKCLRDELIDRLVQDGVGQVDIASLRGDGLFSDGDWVESKDQDPEGSVRLTQLADVGVGVFRDRSNRWMRLDQASSLSCTFLEPGDILIARMPDPLGRACQVPRGIGKAVSVVDVAILRCVRDDVVPRYVMHAINSAFVRQQILSFQAGGTRPRITRSNLGTVRIPLPGLKAQEKISDALDKFDALVNDLSIGLPAELAARRKQYEYYRDKLLTFEEAPA